MKNHKKTAEKVINQTKYYTNEGLPSIFKHYESFLLLTQALSYKDVLTNGDVLTRNNHIFPARYYYNWESDQPLSVMKRSKKERKNLLKARDCKVSYKEKDETKQSRLDNFMAKDCFFLQNIEHMFNKYPIDNNNADNVVCSTEYITFIERLQTYIDFGLIDSFYMLHKKSNFNYESATHQVTPYGCLNFINPLPDIEGYPQKRCDNFYNEFVNFQNVHLDVYIKFFKTRQLIWNFAASTNNLTVYKILDVILSDKDPFKNYPNVMSCIPHFFANFAVRYGNPEFIVGEIKEDAPELYNQVKKQFESDVVFTEKNKLETLKFIQFIQSEIVGLDYENSFIYKAIISNFFIDKLNSYVHKENHYGTLCLYLDTPLKTKENPILIEKISQEDSIDIIKKGILNGKDIRSEYESLSDEDKQNYFVTVPFLEEDIQGEYKNFSQETEVSFLALTPNILLINAENWMCDFLLSFYRIGQQDKIVHMYEQLYEKTALKQNDKIIVKISGVKK